MPFRMNLSALGKTAPVPAWKPFNAGDGCFELLIQPFPDPPRWEDRMTVIALAAEGAGQQARWLVDRCVQDWRGVLDDATGLPTEFSHAKLDALLSDPRHMLLLRELTAELVKPFQLAAEPPADPPTPTATGPAS
jgi:hypothetical protein